MYMNKDHVMKTCSCLWCKSMLQCNWQDILHQKEATWNIAPVNKNMWEDWFYLNLNFLSPFFPYSVIPFEECIHHSWGCCPPWGQGTDVTPPRSRGGPPAGHGDGTAPKTHHSCKHSVVFMHGHILLWLTILYMAYRAVYAVV